MVESLSRSPAENLNLPVIFLSFSKAGLVPAQGICSRFHNVKVSLVLTFSVLIAGLMVANGCARSRLASKGNPAKATVQSVSAERAIQPELPQPAVQPIVATAISPKPQVVTEPPPRPQVEVVGAPPAVDLTWIPGHWDWDGHWVWKAGEWAHMPSPSASWIPGRWARRDPGWVWIPGYWSLLASR